MRGLWIIAVLTSVTCSMTERGACAELSWDAPPHCPTRDDVTFRIERALGSNLADAAPVRFTARVQRRGSGFSARLGVEGDGLADAKQRTLSAPDCTKLADAVAVAVALALGARPKSVNEEAHRPAEPPSDPPAPGAGAQPVNPAAKPLDPVEAVPEEESPAPVPSASLWLLGDMGSLPALGPGAALGAELGWSRLQLRALALLVFEQHVERAGQAGLGPDAGADLALFAGSLSACVAAIGSFRAGSAVFLCAGPELGRLSGRGTGVSERRTGGGWWLAPRVDLGALWRVPGSSLDLGLIASAGAPLLRDDFVLEGAVPVHRASSVLGRLALGVALVLD